MDNPQISLALLVEIRALVELVKNDGPAAQSMRFYKVAGDLDHVFGPILKQKIEVKQD